jgi:hypothetical protein
MRNYAMGAAKALALTELERAVAEQERDDILVAALQAASELRIPLTTIAAETGLTRTRAYAVLERTTGVRGKVPADVLRRLAACALNDTRPLSLVQHAEQLRVEASDLHRALLDLAARNAAEILARTGDSSGREVDAFWIPGPALEGWLEHELERLRWVRSDRWAVYVRLPNGVRHAVSAAAEQIAPSASTVISQGTALAVTWDELAVAIPAADSREAIEGVAEMWTSITESIGTPMPFSVTEVLPPSSR